MSASTLASTAAIPSPTATRFSRPRFALLVLLGVYPIITALLYIVLPLTEGWTIWQRTLVIAPLMVGMMIWGLIPQVQTRFRTFLNPATK
jgi:antibiotic biosynthesis monooxygenase (ABM) superfamily enzyme